MGTNHTRTSALDSARCKASVHDPRTSWPRYHQCQHKAVTDGYCRVHHPDARKVRYDKSVANYKAKIDNTPLAHARRRIDELEVENAALRDRLEKPCKGCGL